MWFILRKGEQGKQNGPKNTSLKMPKDWGQLETLVIPLQGIRCRMELVRCKDAHCVDDRRAQTSKIEKGGFRANYRSRQLSAEGKFSIHTGSIISLKPPKCPLRNRYNHNNGEPFGVHNGLGFMPLMVYRSYSRGGFLRPGKKNWGGNPC